MKRMRNEIVWMLGALMLFSWCVGFLYSQQHAESSPVNNKVKKSENNVPVNHAQKKGLHALPAESILGYLHSLLVSRSVDKIIELLLPLPGDEAFNYALAIIEDQNQPLEREDELQLIGALAHHFADKSDLQQKFFSLILEDPVYYKNKKNEEPFAYVLARFGYASVLPVLHQWALEQHKQEKDPSKSIKKILGNFINNALYYATHKDDLNMLRAMQDAGVSISQKKASQLLLVAAKNPRTTGEVVEFLKERGADLNSSDKKHMMPLTYAIKNNNEQLVERLLKAGADPNRMPHVQVGPPLQQAISKGFVDIEKLLRAHGAKE